VLQIIDNLKFLSFFSKSAKY